MPRTTRSGSAAAGAAPHLSASFDSLPRATNVTPLALTSAVWSLLPAFRAAAEEGNLQAAGKRLFVTASAVSRSIRHLEETLGTPLFARSGRGLKLNQRGAQLLDATRAAMAAIDASLSGVAAAETGVALKVSCPNEVARTWLLPAWHRLRLDSAEDKRALDVKGPLAETVDALARGTIDLALTWRRPAQSPAALVYQGHCCLFARREHPARARAPLSPENLAALRLVAVVDDSEVGPIERWPCAGLPAPEATMGSSDLAARACVDSDWVCVLPDGLVPPGLATQLTPLPVDTSLPVAQLWALFAEHSAAAPVAHGLITATRLMAQLPLPRPSPA